MISRFGSVELNCVLNYLAIIQKKSFLNKSINYIKGLSKPFWWEKGTVNAMSNNAGFFPKIAKMLERFSIKILEDIGHIDILGSWLKEEIALNSYLHNAIKVPLMDLQSYYHKKPLERSFKR